MEPHLAGRLLGWRPRTLLVGIVVLALGTRLAVAMLTKSWVFPSDSNFFSFGYEMGQIAASLAQGNGFSWPDGSVWPPGPTAWMPPVYPFIMAGVFKIFGIFSIQAAITLELFLTIMSVLTCIFAYFLGRRLYNAHVGLGAALLLAIYPPSIHYAVRNLWETSLFTSCLLLIILMFLKLSDHPHIKGGMFLGIVLGFTALVNPIIMGVYPFAFIWLYLKAEGNRRMITKTMSFMLAISCLIISPWLVRNYIVFGKLVFIKSNFGNELYLGNNEYGTGDDDNATVQSRINMATVFTEAEREFLKQSDEVTRNRFLFRKAALFIAEHPLRFVQQTMARFARYWTYMRHEEGWQARVSLTIYLAILTLSAAGVLLSKVKGRDIELALLFLLGVPLPYYFTIVKHFRYRFPIEPILIIFAVYTIYWLMLRFFWKGRGIHLNRDSLSSIV